VEGLRGLPVLFDTAEIKDHDVSGSAPAFS
jgi:hypothetical protein